MVTDHCAEVWMAGRQSRRNITVLLGDSVQCRQDCSEISLEVHAKPALMDGSNLLWWADVYGRQNRGVKGHIFAGPPA